ncbi:hypothetical protein GIX45_13965 [Erwinia sp. CPCC 100877]|nr:hypothetical protein [Erwinia sp. CPCC 100877]
MRTLDHSEYSEVSGAGAIQDMIVGYYENMYSSMFPGNQAKAIELGKSVGKTIGSSTESQLEKLSMAGLDTSAFMKALEKRYSW